MQTNSRCKSFKTKSKSWRIMKWQRKRGNLTKEAYSPIWKGNLMPRARWFRDSIKMIGARISLWPSICTDHWISMKWENTYRIHSLTSIQISLKITETYHILDKSKQILRNYLAGIIQEKLNKLNKHRQTTITRIKLIPWLTNRMINFSICMYWHRSSIYNLRITNLKVNLYIQVCRTCIAHKYLISLHSITIIISQVSQ